jgi:hypothetical protein
MRRGYACANGVCNQGSGPYGDGRARMLSPMGGGGEECGCGNDDPCATGGGSTNPPPVGVCPTTRPTQGRCGCLGLNQLVTKACGTEVPVSDLKIGDKIEGINCDRQLSEQTITEIDHLDQPCLLIRHERGEIICSTSHLLLVNELDAIPAYYLRQDEHRLMAADGSLVNILGIDFLDTRPVINIVCTPDHTYLSQGIWHHNKVMQADVNTAIAM